MEIKCSKCKLIKTFLQFAPDKRRPLGNQSQCRKCQSESHKEKKYWRRYYQNFKKQNQKRNKEIKQKYGIGSRTIRTYGLKLALLVYDRAGRKCEKCGEVNDLTIHHKDGNGRHNQEKGLPMNNNPKNLIVLCRRCHGSIHGKESKKNLKRK